MKLLDAVNVMLESVGQLTLDTTDQLENSYDGQKAIRVLNEIKVEVLSKGWDFNTSAWTFLPDSRKRIAVPSTVLQLDPTGSSDYILKNQNLFNKSKITFEFDSPVACDVIWDIDFDNLPYAAKRYICLKAARVFQARLIGDSTIYNMHREDEKEAWRTLLQYDCDTADYNMLDNTDVARLLR